MPKKHSRQTRQTRKERRKVRQMKAAKEYREKLYARENEMIQPGCMTHTASALKHHYYPKRLVNSIVSATKALRSAAVTLKKRSNKKTKIHPKKGGYHCMTMKKKHKKRINKRKTYKKYY